MAPILSLKPLLLVTAIVAAMCQGGETGLLPPKTTVQIINTLPKHEDLTLHCKDKHHDLGEHTLKFEESFEFRFRPNLMMNSTLYFCSFWWQSGEPRYFDIYKQERDKCKVCTWKVTEYGPCLFGVCYPWNKSQPRSTLVPDNLDRVITSNAKITRSCP
ncbi:S-protein homolog 5-like [Prosopis cineraria]|uniref:S-protein homolog 5-like n=1 Tax=Prosopis cineraria TaxID=364024 RepID=UPI00240F59D7|nr:S-protein homolog 5-like [Prosopis cineraria]